MENICDFCKKKFTKTRYHKHQKNCNTKCYMRGWRRDHIEYRKLYAKKYYINQKNKK